MYIAGHWNSDNVSLQAEQSIDSKFTIFLLVNTEAIVVFNIEKYLHVLPCMSPTLRLSLRQRLLNGAVFSASIL
jgi:hypothetical protein